MCRVYLTSLLVEQTRQAKKAILPLCFVSDKAIGKLEYVKEIAFDGTYFVCPYPFYQLWTIIGESDGQLFPMISVLNLWCSFRVFFLLTLLVTLGLLHALLLKRALPESLRSDFCIGQ
jgi:hypothetical protein